MTVHSNVLRIKQAFPNADFNVSNYFPVVGDSVSFTNVSDDNDSNSWEIYDGSNPTPTVSSNINESIVIDGTDAIVEKLDITNTVGTDSHTEIIYGLDDPTNAYYTVDVSTNVCRESDSVILTPISIYSNPDAHTLKIDIINSFDDSVYYSNPNVVGPISVPFSSRGQYNVVLTATTGANDVVYKQDRLITVTPPLQVRGSAYEWELLSSEDSFIANGIYTNNLDETAGLSPGDTIVVSLPDGYTQDQIFRMRIDNIHGTLENPITITIDESSKLTIPFDSWYGLFIGNCSHLIIDGKGYQNLDTGLFITGHPDTDTAVTGIQVGNGSTNIETHNLEFSNTGFAGMVCKTDPTPDNPEYWRGAFDMENTTLHNCYFHDTRSEGIYYGYFNTDVKTGTNSSGETVQYRAHSMKDTKIYRNRFIKCGWDSIQLNNATGDSVIHDNYIEDTAFFGEPDQNTGMSLGMEGKIYNNTINGGSGLGIQVGVLGPLDIYNNVISRIPEGSPALYLLSSENVPEQNVVDNTNNIPINVYNNNFITIGNVSTVGAQNVAQYLDFQFKNNTYTADELFSGQASETISQWYDNESNNIKLVEEDYGLYKIGSMLKNEFNIYPDSILTTGGSLIGDQFDARGFKNWYDSDKFIGAFAGIVELSSNILSLNSVIINNGDADTASRDVSLTIGFIGSPTHVMISEESDFSGALWTPYTPGTIPYQLTTGGGIKTIYLKLKNDATESGSLSDTINYSGRLHYLVNLNKQDVYPVPALWNDWSGQLAQPIPTGLQLSSITDQYSTASSLNLEITDQFDKYGSNASSGDTYLYPYEVCRFNWTVDGTRTKGTIELSGCNQSKTYNITLYAVKKYENNDCYYSVNGVDQIYNADKQNNPDALVTWTNVVPVAGVITIDVKTIDAKDAHLGLIDIYENE